MPTPVGEYDERLWILQERLVRFLIRTLTGVLTVGILAFLLDGFHFGFTLSEAFPKFWAGLIAGLLLFLGNVLRHMSARPPPPLILVGKDKLGHSKPIVTVAPRKYASGSRPATQVFGREGKALEIRASFIDSCFSRGSRLLREELAQVFPALRLHTDARARSSGGSTHWFGVRFNALATEAFFANGISQPTSRDSLPFDTDVRLLSSQITRVYFFLFFTALIFTRFPSISIKGQGLTVSEAHSILERAG